MLYIDNRKDKMLNFKGVHAASKALRLDTYFKLLMPVRI